MIIPYNTDAPIYHYPFATLGLIAANVVCFVATAGGDPAYYDTWLLKYGHGLDPTEWITCLFFHFGFVHLAGNLLFLWAFGLVVEGKVGWKRFLLVYAGIGVLHGSIEQLIMLGYQGETLGSAGASGVIFGLMAMSLVWAPRNDISCMLVLFFFIIRVVQFEISIQTLSLLYLALETVSGTFRVLSQEGPFSMTSELIHLLGGVIGFCVATVMLKRGLVDCENWDLFAVMKGTYGSPSVLEEYRKSDPVVAATRAELPEDLQQKTQQKRHKTAARIRELLEQSKPQSALRELQQLQHLLPDYRLDEVDLHSLVSQLYRGKQWAEVVPLIEEFIDRFPDAAAGMRLRLAAIFFQIQDRPRAALRVAEPIDETQLKDHQRRELERLRIAAQRRIDDGHLELSV